MSSLALLNTARSNLLRILLSAVAAVALSAGAAATPADARPATAKADAGAGHRVVATTSATKRRSTGRKVRVRGRGVYGRATGRKVG